MLWLRKVLEAHHQNRCSACKTIFWLEAPTCTPLPLDESLAETSCTQRDSIHQVFSTTVHTLCGYRKLRVFLLRSSQANHTESGEGFYVRSQKSPRKFIEKRKMLYADEKCSHYHANGYSTYTII